ncbi:hypothetical protein ASH00_15730 [Arthrobacter sp. Soil782]|uniref:FtsK/SpoIIIE domain-containing protein n=1 Tax=Arthrobacter sp. Soil782 TaxID=1736410 RepID=UPI0006F4373E|nr:FtsK/SpoIIIE domain-containing protein [Arthrobacter sp. Soil782]KRF03234.1 hypothetical protein ASH00_15730 [Arthrobacter sp. Soil782]
MTITAHETTTAAPRFIATIGNGEKGHPVSLDLTSNPHTLIIGSTGSGKSTLVHRLIERSAAAGANIVAVDVISHGRGFSDSVEPSSLVTDVPEAIKTLEDVLDEIIKRQELLREHGVLSWRHLPNDVRRTEDVRPLVIAVDEYGTTVTLHPTLPRGVDTSKGHYRASSEHNAAAERISFLVQRILLEAKSTGVHLVLITMRNSVPGIMQDHLHNRILVLRPGGYVGGPMIAATFRAVDRMDAGRLAETLSPLPEPGAGILASETGGVQSFRFPYAG